MNCRGQHGVVQPLIRVFVVSPPLAPHGYRLATSSEEELDVLAHRHQYDYEERCESTNSVDTVYIGSTVVGGQGRELVSLVGFLLVALDGVCPRLIESGNMPAILEMRAKTPSLQVRCKIPDFRRVGQFDRARGQRHAEAQAPPIAM